MAEDAVLQLLPGTSFHGRYGVVRQIKAGGMGAVYEVVDDRTNAPRALKMMLPSLLGDAELRARFALEAKVTGNIASDHLVRVSDAGIDEPTGMPFLVMELLRGQELASLVEQRGPLPPAEVVLYLHQTALALDKTHAAGIVHRDLKPENLFVTYRDDGTPCLKILDFGVAKVVAQGTARTTRAVGTPMFMAPEQLMGEASIGPRADLFALAHIAYALLAGEPYWEEEAHGVDSLFPLLSKIMAGVKEAPTARARRRRGVALPAAFDAWMAKGVAKQPERRFDRATAQVEALAEVLGVAAPRGSLSSAVLTGDEPTEDALPPAAVVAQPAGAVERRAAAPARPGRPLPKAFVDEESVDEPTELYTGRKAGAPAVEKIAAPASPAATDDDPSADGKTPVLPPKTPAAAAEATAPAAVDEPPADGETPVLPPKIAAAAAAALIEPAAAGPPAAVPSGSGSAPQAGMAVEPAAAAQRSRSAVLLVVGMLVLGIAAAYGLLVRGSHVAPSETPAASATLGAPAGTPGTAPLPAVPREEPTVAPAGTVPPAETAPTPAAAAGRPVSPGKLPPRPVPASTASAAPASSATSGPARITSPL
jgi:serine/threonine-protein kinase